MIKNLLDKICFALGVMVFLQLPHFIDQYTQRMGGFAESMQQQISEYQSIADEHFQGDVMAYIERLENNSDPAVARSAVQVANRLQQAEYINADLTVYEQQPLWYQMPYFFTHLRLDLAKGTLRNFAPGLPLNLWAWGYGLVGGILFSLLFNGTVKAPGAIRRKISKPAKNRHSPKLNI
ncbi:DUF2937 family protein [Marinicella sediminis]|uniref:DUF2937 family protein n=1 Tax=Marinicella sediminis TaxID=1792834 RepID=A0ABV7J7N1_9GAMM|nr:DUF2937 family protein [Marinicella sediminis]